MRVEQLAPQSSVWLGTYHRFCARLLRKYASFVGLQEKLHNLRYGRRLSDPPSAAGHLKVDLGHLTPDQVAHAISWAKNGLVTAAEYQPRPGHPLGVIVKRVYPAYQEQLRRANAVDFDDLLLSRGHPAPRQSRGAAEPRRALSLHPGRRVPGYQPGPVCHRPGVVDRLSQPGGDRRPRPVDLRLARSQSEEHLGVRRDYPDVHVVRLEQNYRSTKRILRWPAT